MTMHNTCKLLSISLLTVLLAFGAASAKVSKEEAAKLGNELTPMGGYGPKVKTALFRHGQAG